MTLIEAFEHEIAKNKGIVDIRVTQSEAELIVSLLKNREHQNKCPCQGCHPCMCEDYRIWAGLPEPT